MDRQEIIILFIVAVIAAIGLYFVFSNLNATGDITYPQLQQANVVSCFSTDDCVLAFNSLDYECRGGYCRPVGAIGPPQYEPRLKIR
jgi:hypothetical protein